MIDRPWIKLKDRLDRADCDLINALSEACVRHEPVALKLELDYKLAAGLSGAAGAGLRELNEFLYFDGPRLVGYLGICGFGGRASPLEMTGMVHPDCRRLGVFSTLHALAAAEARRRNAGGVFLLCDRASGSGQGFLKKIGAAYNYSEFEMYLRGEACGAAGEALCGVALRRAANADAREIARQNAVYFGSETPGAGAEEGAAEGLLLPEEEEKRGMAIYLAEKANEIVGKVHLQLGEGGVGGVYGLGVLPEHRGRGLGRAVLSQAVQRLKEAGAKEILLQVAAENATALGLYKSCGFQVSSTMDYYDFV